MEEDYKGTKYEASVSSLLSAQFKVQPMTDIQEGEESNVVEVPQQAGAFSLPSQMEGRKEKLESWGQTL